MHHVSKQGILFVQKFEGFRAKAYQCPAGYKTIGYGHVLQHHDQFEEVSLEQAAMILLQDLAIAARGVIRNTRVELEQHQFDAVVSLVFNIGIGAYQRSTLRAKLNRHEHDDVVNEFKRWIWFNRKVSSGLLRRREAEAMLYKYKVYE